MKLLELAGLPGSGKTTLCRSLDKAKYATVPKNRALNGLAPTVRRFPGYTAPWAPSQLKILYRDSWASKSLLSYPNFFSEVLALVALVPLEGRHRAISLNYWRRRAVNYSLLDNLRRDRVAVADEGFIQTLLSTVIRIPTISPSDLLARTAISGVVQNMPPVDGVVVLNISAENILDRGAKPAHWSLTRRTADWLDLILSTVESSGTDVIEIDARNPSEQVLKEFESLEVM